MYVILNEECTHVFQGISPTGRPRWESIEDLKKEQRGFQLAIFKDTVNELKFLDGFGLNPVEMRLTKFLDMVD